jgi:hypothetical protein
MKNTIIKIDYENINNLEDEIINGDDASRGCTPTGSEDINELRYSINVIK